jgi:hypothetical protein
MITGNNYFKYVGLEFVKFLIPIFITFLTACFFSKLFSSKELFETYVAAKINAHLTNEFLSILGAITVLLGVLFIIKNLSGFNILDKVLNLILEEIPKNITIFGGAITGSMYALSWYSYSYEVILKQTPMEIFALGTCFAITFFIYAVTLQYLIDRKKLKDKQQSENSSKD